MKKSLKGLTIGLIIINLITYTNISFAANKKDLQNEKENLTSAISEAQENLKEIKEKKSDTLNQVETLMHQISEYKSQIEELDTQISDLQQEIKNAESQIKKDEEEYEKQQNALNDRLVTMYEGGEVSYLDFLLSSSSLTDFISSYYMITEIATYDTEMLEKIEAEKKAIEKEKQKLEESKASLDTAKKTKESKAAALNVAKKEKEQKATQLSNEEKSTQKEIEEMLEDKAIIDKQLQKIAEEEARKVAEAAKAAAAQKNNSSSKGSSSSVTAPLVSAGSSGYIFPVLGCSKANISTLSYPSYSGHTGIDVNINVTGKSVVAVKDGVVATSTALRNSNGSYRSYGEYIIITHGDGTATLYAHMLAGSRRVSPGASVKQGQVIGTVGSTGNSTGNHLHFEVRVIASSGSGYTWRVVNPLPYLP